MNDPQGHNRSGPDLSRRQFLKGSSAAAAATALAEAPLQALAAPQTGTSESVASHGPNPFKIQLNVNGQNMTTDVEPRVTLLDALRNYLDVTGCKRVCDRGTCGACTVLLDGKPVYSCTMLAARSQGKQIRTAESLVDAGQARRRPGRLRPARRPAVRLLHARLRRRHEGRPSRRIPSDAGRDRRRPRRQHLPLRHLRTNAAGDRGSVQEGRGA